MFAAVVEFRVAFILHFGRGQARAGQLQKMQTWKRRPTKMHKTCKPGNRGQMQKCNYQQSTWVWEIILHGPSVAAKDSSNGIGTKFLRSNQASEVVLGQTICYGARFLYTKGGSRGGTGIPPWAMQLLGEALILVMSVSLLLGSRYGSSEGAFLRHSVLGPEGLKMATALCPHACM